MPAQIAVHLVSLHMHQSSALQQLKHRCVITSIFINNPKHSFIWASTKKKNFIAAKTRDTNLLIPPDFACSGAHEPLAFQMIHQRQRKLSEAQDISVAMDRRPGKGGWLALKVTWSRFQASQGKTQYFFHIVEVINTTVSEKKGKKERKEGKRKDPDFSKRINPLILTFSLALNGWRKSKCRHSPILSQCFAMLKACKLWPFEHN